MDKIDYNENVSMTYSRILKTTKTGETFVRVRFERGIIGKEGNPYMEGILPSGEVTESEGFTEEEVSQMADFMVKNRDDIMEKAKDLGRYFKIFGD